ncbi:MAG: DUF2510 domain-containing protein [Acidimicrobiaceae bacterium]|nr:DUF2510 domain-containing protein [Acidimicrobiaceae bacterium]
MTDLPPADWYTDPEDSSQYRYWDGSRWTDHRSPRYGTPDGEAGASGDRAAPRHRSIRSLLGGTWRLMTQNLRPLLVIYAVVGVVYLAGEESVRRGFDDVFGDTLGALVDEVASVDPETDDEELDALLESRWNDVTDRLESLGSSTLAAGILLMAAGAVVVIAINIVQFVAFGQVAVARLGQRQMGATGALRASLKRLLRIVGVGLMLLAMLFAALMVASLLAGLLSPASGALAVVLGAATGLVVMGVAAPLALLTLMTAAVGPAEPSMRYARGLLRGAFWATFGRMVLIFVLSFAATVPALAAAELLGLLNGVVARVALVGLGMFPEMLGVIAFFTIYHDLGGRHADIAEPSASSAN